MTVAADIRAAEARIRPHIRETPAERSVLLSDADTEVFLKLENFQVSGSFKARGALNKLCSLSEEERARGVLAASSGNHGAATAYGARLLGIDAKVFVPKHADPAKIHVIKTNGAKVEKHGDDCVETEAEARRVAAAEGRVYVSPYNDYQVMCGQGSIGVELARQCGPLDAVFVALGGGGLIAGIGHALKDIHPATRMIACSPEQSPAMHACLEAGAVIEVPCHETLSDATAGGVEPGAITFEHCQRTVDRSLLLTEAQIQRATRDFILSHHMLIEGAAGAALAGFLEHREEFRGQRVAIVVCGANIGEKKLMEVLK
jgi:threonine dehydratase